MDELKINKNEMARFNGKMYLDTFTLDLNNSFESSADKEIKRLISENTSSSKKYDTLNRKFDGKYNEKEEMEKQNCIIGNLYRDEQIWALIEMKIIYAFKFLEINIKRMLRTFFRKTSTKYFFRWNSVNTFLKSKNIKPEILKGYNEILQLKNVNNALKHSDEIPDDLKKRIPEFKVGETITCMDLDSFYKRIKSFPLLYLKALAHAISTELYDFDESKINDIAEELSTRMGKKEAYSLIDVIKSKY